MALYDFLGVSHCICVRTIEGTGLGWGLIAYKSHGLCKCLLESAGLGQKLPGNLGEINGAWPVLESECAQRCVDMPFAC